MTDDRPVEDKIVVLHGASWADYQRLLELRGDHSTPRITFLEGEIEVKSPSKTHESIKSKIGRLVEVWCQEKNLPFEPCGAWTLESKATLRGAEPDECYVFGDLELAQRPDLAIEVMWTSGGVDKLEVYRQLQVREVWFWRRNRLTVHVLEGERYVERSRSEALTGIDLDALNGLLALPTHQAIREFRALIQQSR